SAASRVQRALLPESPPSVSGVETAWTFLSCSHVAGDMFNVFSVDDHHLGVYVLDVSGHGVPAALLSVSVSRVLHPNPKRGGILRRLKLGAPGGYELVPPAQVAQELNRRFPQGSVANQYFTLIYGLLDTSTGEFRYVRAGHPSPLRLARLAPFLEPVESDGGLPVGIFEDTLYCDEVVQLHPGDRLFLYTDGLTEATGPEETFGEDRLEEFLVRFRALSVADLMDTLKAELAAFQAGVRQRDDVTAVCLEWRGRHA
ncbi:MAG: PP2C family protein-serine/threonine phosphatase, partial [Candidatus Eremiobacterota bacterium]